MTGKNDCESGGGTVEINEDTGKPYWALWGADWKGGEDMEDGQPMSFNPGAFPPGTRIVIIEPGPDTQVAQEFYRKFGVKEQPDA